MHFLQPLPVAPDNVEGESNIGVVLAGPTGGRADEPNRPAPNRRDPGALIVSPFARASTQGLGSRLTLTSTGAGAGYSGDPMGAEEF